NIPRSPSSTLFPTRRSSDLYLGDMDEAGRLGVEQAVEGHPPFQDSLFGRTRPEWVEVDVKKVRTERSRRFGDVWLALELIKKLRSEEHTSELQSRSDLVCRL